VEFEPLLELKFEQKHGTSLVKVVLLGRKSGLQTESLSVPVILGEYRVRIHSEPAISDANVSTGTAGRFLNVLQSSVRRDIGREKQHEEHTKKIIENGQENALQVLTISRVTAGVVFKAGIANLNNEGFCALTEAKNRKKIDKKARTHSNKYDIEIKKYTDGIEAMNKSVPYYTAMKDEVYFITNNNKKEHCYQTIEKGKEMVIK
jgi:hypothetical protein